MLVTKQLLVPIDLHSISYYCIRVNGYQQLLLVHIDFLSISGQWGQLTFWLPTFDGTKLGPSTVHIHRVLVTKQLLVPIDFIIFHSIIITFYGIKLGPTTVDFYRIYVTKELLVPIDIFIIS